MADRDAAIALVSHLLRAHSLTETLAALEREAGTSASRTDASLPDLIKALSPPVPEEAAAASIDPLMQPSAAGARVPEQVREVTDAHASNILCVTFAGASRDVLASGGVDKLISLGSAQGGPPHLVATHKAPVLSLAAQPQGSLLASTGMDGRVQLHDVSSAALVQEWPAVHRKRATSARWQDEHLFGTCSADGTVALFRRGGDAGDFAEMVLPLSREHGVTSIDFAPRGAVLVAGLQQSHCLHYYDVAAEKLWPVSMNELDDDHVSFTAMHVAVHPEGKYVAVATDKQRTFVYEWASRKRVRTLVATAPPDDFAPAPRQCWHPDGRHLYLASGDEAVAVWDVGMERQVGVMTGHTAAVRDMCVHQGDGEQRWRLATCSFDKTVRIWE